MNTEQAHAIVDVLAKLLELAGVGIIFIGIVLASEQFIRAGLHTAGWRSAYDSIGQT